MVLSEVSKFLFFILTGGVIGILFDIFRILRKCFKTSDIITYIHDILFLLISAIILLISIFIINGGEIRGYMFVGITLGIIIYLISLSKYFICISTKILLLLKRIIINPIIKLSKKFLGLLKTIARKLSKIFDKIILKNIKNSAKKEKQAKNLTNFNK